MPPPPSSVTPEVVRKVAALARLSVAEEELPLLTAQLARIVSYIDQIREIPPRAFSESASRAFPTPVQCSGICPPSGASKPTG